MNVKLSKAAITMLNALLVQPTKLMPDRHGPSLMMYPVYDVTIALEVAAIIQWMEATVLSRNPSDGKVTAVAYEGPFPETFSTRLESIVNHYKPWGLLTHNCIPYLELVYGLMGKTLADELKSVK